MKGGQNRRPQVDLIGAARPNFMKIAPVFHAARNRDLPFDLRFVHAGQHYDEMMSEVFVRQLSLPMPVCHLGVGSGSHGEQTARSLTSYEKHCSENRPDLTIVVGDVNSTLGCALAASKMSIPVAHLEAGLRSGDRSMPEEINRIATDSVSDWFFTPSWDAGRNLLREGVEEGQIFQVGNLMVDTLVGLSEVVLRTEVSGFLELGHQKYGLVTLHRPSNVENNGRLLEIVHALRTVSARVPLLIVLHPRTYARFDDLHLLEVLDETPTIKTIRALGYLEFSHLLRNSKFAITDSGGIQEETSYLGIPCLTLRPNTERPVTIWEGSNRLVEPHELSAEVDRVLTSGPQPVRRIEGWDGQAALRVVESLEQILEFHS